MSCIDDLLRQLCPNGIEFRPLGEVGEVFRGRRFTKADYVEAGAAAIHYGELYTHYGTSATEVVTHVRTELAPSLRFVRPGDVVIAEVGETLEDVGKAVAWLGNEDVAIHDGCYGFRSPLNPVFVSYYLQTAAFHIEKNPHVARAKVKRLSLGGLKQIRVPVPPDEVQAEIVRVLDLFQSLEAELEAELEARKRQYAHYRDSLLAFEDSSERVRWLTLADVGSLFGGLTGKAKVDFQVGGARFVSYMNVFNNTATDVLPDDFVRVGAGERQRRLQRGDVLFTGSSETPDEAGMSSVVTDDPPEPLYLNSFSIGYRFSDCDIIDPDFAKHLFRSALLRRQIVRTANGVTRFNVSKARLGKVQIPVPPLAEQRRLADIIDKFDTLANDLSVGIPAELAARRHQYEYYRDRLLTFEEAG